MDIDADTLGIPDTEYDAKVIMPSSEFSRIVRDLSGLGESVKIEVSKDGIRFTSDGESANGNILLKQTESAKRRFKNIGKRAKVGSSGDNHEENEDEVKEDENEDEVKEEENEDEEDEKKTKKKIKKEKVKSEDDGDVDMENEEGEKEYKSGNEEEAQSEDEQEETKNKKRKKAPSKKVRSSTSWNLLF
jgi:proliferating cell nuclear antigen